jgi:hypothetical protein
MKRSSGGTPYIISRAAEGVLGLTWDICDSASLWSCCNFLFAQACEAVLDHSDILHCIGHEESVGLSDCQVQISSTRWRIYTKTAGKKADNSKEP